MSVQWFPGHMTRAQRQLEERIKQVDCVIELRDARAVESSANPILQNIIANKPHIVLLAKKDLADNKATQAWVEHFRAKGQYAAALDIPNDNVIRVISNLVKQAMAKEHERQRKRGIRPRATRALIVGIPNVGKSTLINRLNRRRVVDTANKPGLTRSLKLIKVNENLEVIDSPGMLWPKFEDETTGYHLSLIGSINEDVIPFETVVHYAHEQLVERNIIDSSVDVKVYLEKLAVKHNYLINGEWDLNRAQKTFLRDIKNGRYGPISWEFVNDKI